MAGGLELQAALLTFAVAAPPRPSTTLLPDDWSLETLSLAEAKRACEGFCDPTAPLAVSDPQGWLGWSKRGRVRMVLHFIETDVGVASVVDLKAPESEREAIVPLFARMRSDPALQFEWRRFVGCKKWKLCAAYYLLP